MPLQKIEPKEFIAVLLMRGQSRVVGGELGIRTLGGFLHTAFRAFSPNITLSVFSVHFNLGRFAEKASGISAFLRTTDAGSILLFKGRPNEIRKSSPDANAT